jgi:hypothetical protein
MLVTRTPKVRHQVTSRRSARVRMVPIHVLGYPGIIIQACQDQQTADSDRFTRELIGTRFSYFGRWEELNLTSAAPRN